MNGKHEGKNEAADGHDHDRVDVEALYAELAEAKRIGSWLYDHLSGGARRLLGDVSEWPWLLDAQPVSAHAPAAQPPRRGNPDQYRDVLRAFAELQAQQEDPYAAGEDVAATLGLTPGQFDATVGRLIRDGYVTGGKTFAHTYVEAVTDKGMADLKDPDAVETPGVVLRADLASFSGAGYGTVRVPAGTVLRPGQTIALTDDDADTLEAELLAVTGDVAEVQVHWDRKLRRR